MLQIRLFPLLMLMLAFGACNKEDDDSPDPDPKPFEVPATEDIVMYEVNLRAFSPEADFQGITARMDTLKALGVNTLWLMPIHPVGQINSVGQLGSPYSVQNYVEVNPEFGTLDDFKALVDAAHKRGIAVVIDWVANHTSWDNPWIQNTSWYTQDGNGNIVHPPGTNWMDVADLDFNNADMRLAMIDALKYWIEDVGIDGYRCDAADFVPFTFWQQAIDSLEAIPDRDLILLAEGSRADHFTAGFQMNYGWDFYGKIKGVFDGTFSATSIFVTHHSETVNLPEGVRKLRFTTNHDETAWDETPIVLFGGKQGALAASVVTMYLGGSVPLLYNGQEVGLNVNLPFFSHYPINWTINPDMAAEYQRLLKYYRATQALRTGDMTSFSHSDLVVFQRQLGQETVLVAVNVRDAEKEWAVPAELQTGVWKNSLTGQAITLPASMNFQPYEYLVLEKE